MSREDTPTEKEQITVRYTISLLLACVLLGFSGCSSTTSDISMSYREGVSTFVVDAKDYYLLAEENKMMVYERLTGERYPLLNNPLELEESKQMVTGVKSYGNDIYYIGHNSDLDSVITVLDLDTGDSRVLFTEDRQGRKVELFGVTLWEETAAGYRTLNNQLLDFFVFNGQLILIRSESISLFNGSTEIPMYEGYFKDVTSDGSDIFFTDGEGVLCRLVLEEKEVEQFPTIRPTQPMAADHKVFYLDPQRNKQLMVFDLYTQEVSVVLEGTWSSFTVSDRYIWAESQAEHALYRSDLTGGDSKKVSIPFYDDYAVLNSEQKIVIIEYDMSGQPAFSFFSIEDVLQR